jgi:hypothetical protein
MIGAAKTLRNILFFLLLISGARRDIKKRSNFPSHLNRPLSRSRRSRRKLQLIKLLLWQRPQVGLSVPKKSDCSKRDSKQSASTQGRLTV